MPVFQPVIQKALLILALSFLLLLPKPSQAATEAKEFMMSCTYGVLAGTLVGAATLAFEGQPGDKLYKVARGASIGLYVGIALGLYVVYGVPEEGYQDPDIYDVPGYPSPEGRLAPSLDLPVVMAPIFSDQYELEGGAAHIRVLSF